MKAHCQNCDWTGEADLKAGQQTEREAMEALRLPKLES